jgi:hypothetical protein
VAPFDAGVFLTTIIFIGALAFFGIRATLAFVDNRPIDRFDLLATILLMVLIGWGLVRSVKGYRLSSGEIVVERLGPGGVHIPLASIVSAEARSDLGMFIRDNYLSTQGLFGWSGRVAIRKSKDVNAMKATAYGTNPANSVVLEMNDERKVVLTPRDIEGFVEALRDAGVGVPSAREKPKGAYLQGARKKRKK